MMRPVIVLTAVGICSALLLGVVNSFTQQPIKDALEKVKIEAVRSVFPFDVKDVKTVEDGGTVYYEVRAGKKLKGLAVETYTDKGFSGKITILLAVSPEFKIYDYKVLQHLETPGLGDKMIKDDFRKQFKGKSLKGFTWKVKKDGGSVDAITAATISSRAVTDALERGLKLLSKKYGGKK